MRESRIFILAAIFALFFLEVTVFDKLKIFTVKPDLLLVATIFFGFHFGASKGMEAGLVSGILKGLFSTTAFGINLFSYLLIGFLSGYVRKTLYKENFAIQLALANLSVWLLAGIYTLYLAVITKHVPEAHFWLGVLYKGLYTGVIAPCLFFIFAKIYGHKQTEIL